MQPHRRSSPVPMPSLAFILLCALFVILLAAGGASRADVIGQVIVQAAAWCALVVATLFGPRPKMRRAGMAGALLVGMVLIVLVQLVPLPPSVWQAIPGRIVPVDTGRLGVWRPISMVPGATWNALSSLIVPTVVIVLTIMLRKDERKRIPLILLLLVAISALAGLLQFSGSGFDSPFVNDTPGQVSGVFANRNHFALFLAMGCLIAPVWAIESEVKPWRLLVALGFILLFFLTILSTGSRAGTVVGIVAIVNALFISRHALRVLTRNGPSWLFSILIASTALVLTLFVALFVVADRAVSVNRVFSIDGSEDMRVRGMPTVIKMVYQYFPAGSGFGTFDPVFRMNEPFDLLKLTYFNHAHNDYLEVALDGGVMAVLLLVVAILWLGVASVRAYRRGGSAVARLGSALLLLVLIASFFDYPARTPMIMAVMALASLWLGDRRHEVSAALPLPRQQL